MESCNMMICNVLLVVGRITFEPRPANGGQQNPLDYGLQMVTQVLLVLAFGTDSLLARLDSQI